MQVAVSQIYGSDDMYRKGGNNVKKKVILNLKARCVACPYNPKIAWNNNWLRSLWVE
jgi:hypothetical protein